MSLKSPTFTNAIQPVLKAFSNSATTPCNWLALGDSVTEGSTNGVVTSNILPIRWVNVLLATLQTQYTAGVGGPGFLRTYYEHVTAGALTGSAAGANYWTSGGGGTGVSNDTRAFGSQTYNAAANEVITLHYTGTSFMLQFDLGGSSFTVNVDGGGAVTVTPGAGSTMQGTYSSPVLSHTAHTAVLTPTAGQALKVRGAFIYDSDESTGIHMWEHALGGQTSTQYIAAGKPGTVTGLTDPLALCINPVLVTIMLCINDFIFAVNPATSTSNIQTLISNIRSLCTNNPVFLLCIPFEVGQFYGSPPYTYAWQQYVAAIKAVAAADPTNICWIDCTPGFTVPSAGNSYDGGRFGTDLTHPITPGYAQAASLISTPLLPGSAVSFSGVSSRPHPFSPGLAR